jgi:hypothetical protein
VDLNSVVTKATLADAFAVALSRTGLMVCPVPNASARGSAKGFTASPASGE